MTKGITPATCVGSHDDPDVGDTFLVAGPQLRQGASGGAVVDGRGRVVGVIRGAIEDDPREVVAMPLRRMLTLLTRAREAGWGQ